MRITLRDAGATLVTAAVVTGYVGLVAGASWMPITSVRWYAVLFLLVGQSTCTIGAADALADGTTRGAGYLLGPIALVAAVAAVITGNAGVLGVSILCMALLWLVTTSRHAVRGHRAVGR